MMTVSVMYPNSEGATFDMDYYLNKHFAIVNKYAGDAVEKVTVAEGVNGPQGAPATYKVIATLQLKSPEAFQAMMAKHGEEIMGDIPNFTNITPVMQVSEVKMG